MVEVLKLIHCYRVMVTNKQTIMLSNQTIKTRIWENYNLWVDNDKSLKTWINIIKCCDLEFQVQIKYLSGILIGYLVLDVQLETTIGTGLTELCAMHNLATVHSSIYWLQPEEIVLPCIWDQSGCWIYVIYYLGALICDTLTFITCTPYRSIW